MITKTVHENLAKMSDLNDFILRMQSDPRKKNM